MFNFEASRAKEPVQSIGKQLRSYGFHLLEKKSIKNMHMIAFLQIRVILYY